MGQKLAHFNTLLGGTMVMSIYCGCDRHVCC